MRKTTEHVRSASHDAIASLAKQLWESEGRPAGRDLEYWLRAERQLLSNGNRTDIMSANQPATGPVSSRGTSRAIRLPDSITKISHPA